MEPVPGKSARPKAGLCLVMLLASACLWAAETDSERSERQVDRAALVSQDKAIAALEVLAKKHAGTERELILLAKIVEAHQQAAKIQFRLSHGNSQTAADLARYQRRLRNTIDAVAFLVAKYPDDEGVEPTYLARAQAYQELGEKALAQRDYDLVATRFPKSASAASANMSLGALVVEAGDYKQAISYLKRVELLENEQYPFVLHQIAWAYFNLDEVPPAIAHLKRRNEYYRKKAKKAAGGDLSSADRALQEQGLRDIAAFYFSRYDKKDEDFPLKGAMAAFRSAEPGTYFGKMLLHLANLLRSRDRREGLDQWTEQVIEAEPNLPEALEVALVNLESFCEKRSIDPARTTAFLRRLDEKTDQKIRDLAPFPKVLNLLLQGAAGIQERLAKERSPEIISKTHRALALLFNTFVALASDGHPSYLMARYNLAEVHFAEKDFESAAREYRWLVDQSTSKLPAGRPTLSLKAIVSEYRLLLKKDLIPKDLSPGKLSGESTPDLKALPSAPGSWVGRVGAHLENHGRQPEGMEEFEYEAYRILYANGQTRAALKGMSELVKERPRVSVSLPSAKLVLDTFLVNEDWVGAREIADEFRKVRSLGDEAFQKRLADVSAETVMRMAEQAANKGDFAVAARLSQEFLRKYPSSRLAPHALLMASRAALQSRDIPRGRQLLADLLTRYPAAENRAVALLLMAGLAESDFDFDEAARDLSQALSLPGGEQDRPRLARRFFFASWISAQPQPLDCERFRAPADLHRDCDRYRGLIAWDTEGRGITQAEAVEKALKGYEEVRPIWSAVALKIGMAQLGLKERLVLAKTLATRWKSLDPLVQFTLIAGLNRTIPEAFQVGRETLPKLAPLRANSRSLVRRIGLIREMETTIEEIVDLPWAQVKISLLAALAEVYRDFCDELAKLPRPKDLTPEELKEYDSSVAEILTPFRAKGETIRTQVKKLAAHSPVDPKSVPGLAPSLPPTRALASSTRPETDLLRALFEEIRHIPPPEEGRLPPEKLATLWAAALKENASARSSFFFQELKEKFKVRDITLGAMRAIALARAGAKAEALEELESAKPGLAPSHKRLADQVLVVWYESSTVPDKAKPLAVETGLRGRKP